MHVQQALQLGQGRHARTSAQLPPDDKAIDVRAHADVITAELRTNCVIISTGFMRNLVNLIGLCVYLNAAGKSAANWRHAARMR